MADISKIKILEGEALNIKDATARQDMTTLLGGETLKALGAAAWKAVAAGITDGETGLATGGQVYDAIQKIGKALHFVGIAEKKEGETELQAVERTYPAAAQMEGAIAICGTKEFICFKDKGAAANSWHEFGDEGIWETKAHAEATYVPKTRTIAGVDLQDDITASEMKTALELKALAYKDNASGSINTVDTATVAAGKAGSYNVSAQTVTIPKTYNALDVTPAGTVGVTKTTGASVSYQTVDTVTVSGATATEGQTPNFTPAGTVSKPNVSASLDLKETSVATVTSSGTGYTITDGNVTKGTDSTSKFAKTGMLVALDETDTEMLCFTNATTADAVTASGSITYTKQTLSGALPTFGSADVVIKTGSTAAASLDAAPTFTGSGAVLSASATTKAADATVTDAVYSGSFSGTSASVTPTVATTEDASVTAGSVTVASDTFDVTLNKTSKTVTVS